MGLSRVRHEEPDEARKHQPHYDWDEPDDPFQQGEDAGYGAEDGEYGKAENDRLAAEPAFGKAGEARVALKRDRGEAAVHVRERSLSVEPLGVALVITVDVQARRHERCADTRSSRHGSPAGKRGEAAAHMLLYRMVTN